jgi:hypothetical protein
LREPGTLQIKRLFITAGFVNGSNYIKTTFPHYSRYSTRCHAFPLAAPRGLTYALIMRPHRLVSFIASIVALLFIETYQAYALDEKLLGSILVLTSPNGCGTGFRTTGGTILTANHLAEALCTAGKCLNIELGNGKEVNGEAVERHMTNLRVVWRFPEYDVAALSEADGSTTRGYFGTTITTPIVKNQEVFTLGFARCKSLSLSAGQVQSASPIDAETSLMVQSGMSGAPVFTGQGQLVGVIHGAASLLGRTFAQALSRPFAAAVSRFTAPMINPVDESYTAISNQLQLVSDYYTDAVVPATGHNRLWRSLHYQDIVRLHRSRYARSLATQPLALLLASSEDYPAPPLNLGRSDTERLAIIANLRAQLEQHGAYRYTFVPIAKIPQNSALDPQSSDEAALFTNTVSAFASGNYLGSTLMQTSFALTYGGGLILVTSLWLASIAYAWGRLYGTALRKRVWVSFLVAVAGWPISLIVFLRSANRWVTKTSQAG